MEASERNRVQLNKMMPIKRAEPINKKIGRFGRVLSLPSPSSRTTSKTKKMDHSNMSSISISQRFLPSYLPGKTTQARYAQNCYCLHSRSENRQPGLRASLWTWGLGAACVGREIEAKSPWFGHMAAISSTAWRLICKAAIWDPSTTASLSVVRAYLPMKHRMFLLWLSSLRPVQNSQPDEPAHLSRFLHMTIEAVHLLNLLKACRCFNRRLCGDLVTRKKYLAYYQRG